MKATYAKLNSSLHLTAGAVLLAWSSTDLDDPDVPGPSASGMPRTAGHSPDAQPNMQTSAMEPEVSNGVHGADPEVRRSFSRHNKHRDEEPVHVQAAIFPVKSMQKQLHHGSLLVCVCILASPLLETLILDCSKHGCQGWRVCLSSRKYTREARVHYQVSG